ncbi:M15 family metallopeptidase [Mariniluteicoccus flavus]
MTPIQQRYAELGGPTGELGAPTSPEFAAGRGLTAQIFERGNLYWRADLGVTLVRGPILQAYGRHGWEHGTIDAPTAGEFRSGDGRSVLNWFAGNNGTTIIHNPATGAHVVQGAVRDKWHALGAEFHLGLPTTDEFAGNDGGRSRLNFFAGPGFDASIVWTPSTGAHEVRGAIRERWHTVGAEGGALGAPTSDEFEGQRARVNRFERGLIIWTPASGAHPVLGALLDEYARRGWEGGDLGAPTSGEWRFDGGWGQDFQNGRLLFHDNGTFRTQVSVNAYVRQAQPADVQKTYRAGCPVGPDQLRVVEMNHLGYDGRIRRGMMVLRWDAVDRTINAFAGGGWDSFPINSMLNPDVWGNDPDQMAANNTSGFFCRSVVGNPYSQSPHSYGRSVDVNTVQNPYFDGSRWWPANGTPWIDRNRRDPGMLFDSGIMTRNMTDNGYFWGGWWAARDYQHFQIN